jgi:prepilin-type N-terminal cleavage/methylation domain-containing protein
MNKRGLTLIELMAAIAIVALLAVMITPGILAVRDSVMESTLETRISMIENAAKDYAHEHIDELISYKLDATGKVVFQNYVPGDKKPNEYCIYRTVNFLIINGYITNVNTYTASNGEKEAGIIDPTTGENMNSRRVCIRFDTMNAMSRQIVAYLVEEGE